MKQTVFKMPMLFLIISLLFLFCGCRKTDNAAPPAPFSALSWDAAKDDILSLEGNNYTTYDSVYGGICYTYPKTYEGYEGTIKYMLDDKERLMCIAWTCPLESDEALSTLYQLIRESVTKENGEASQETDESTNYGNVWRREEGNIVISSMTTSSMKVLQYAYLHPDVSNPGHE